MRPSRLLTGGAIVAVLAGAAACGLQTLEPKLELRQAASDFAAQRTGGVRLSLGSSAAQFRAFAAEGDKEDGTPGSTTISDADLNRLLTSSLSIAYDGGATKDTADDAARIDVHIGKLDAGEVRVAHQVVYARVDLSGLEQEFPDMKDGVESARASLAGEDGSAPPEALKAPADALFAGKWVSLDVGPDSWLQKQLKAASGGSTTDGSAGGGMTTGLPGGLAADAPAKLKAIAGKAFANGVTVKRLDSDEQLGDHLVATTNLRTVYKNVHGDLAGLFTGPESETIGKALPQVSDVPDRQLSVSFWVKDGKLTRVELDLAQFLSKPSGALVLRADNLPAQKITAPAGAVRLDLQAIAEQTGMNMTDLLAGGSSVGGVTATMDAHTIASYVDEDISGMAQGDGAAPSLDYLPQAIQDIDGMADGLVIRRAGNRIQVNLGAQAACLVLPPTADATGTITDGPCS